jgi:hypothetical protein
MFARISSSPPICGAERASAASLFEGVRFLRGNVDDERLQHRPTCHGVRDASCVCSRRSREGLGGGPGLYGLLLSSVAGGAFVASLTSGWTSRVRRQGVALLIAVAAWGTTIAGQPSKDVSSTPTSNQPEQGG